MTEHRVETWWTTGTWTAVCLGCPWQIDGSYEDVTEAAAAHTLPKLTRRRSRKEIDRVYGT